VDVKPMLSVRHRYISILIIALVIISVFAVHVLAVEDFNAVEKAIDSQKVEKPRLPTYS